MADHMTSLRRRAEELLATGRPRLEAVERSDLEALVHELQVSHIELELQNEELLRARQQLEASRDRYQELYDLAPVGYLRLDSEGRVLEANLTAAVLLGCQRGQLRGKRLSGLVDRSSQDDYARHRQEVLDRGETATCELRIRCGDGRTFWARMITQPAEREDEGELWVTLSDISRLKGAEEELRALNATLEERVAERTVEVRMQAQMLRALANEITHVELRERRQIAELVHDTLKQELAGARMLLGGLLRTLEEGDEARTRLEELDVVLVDSIRTCRTLTDELCPPVLRGAGLATALEYLGSRFQEKRGLRVRVVAGTDLEPASERASALLYRSVNELLHNVSKYAGVPDATVTLRSPRPGWLEVEVRDVGDGFDTSRLDEPTSPGFGLFAVRERLEMLGGRFSIDSGPGRGTTVTLTVPVDETEARRAEPGPGGGLEEAQTSVAKDAEAAAAVDTVRVLVADDHRVMREGLVNLLGREPDVVVVGSAKDGQEAVEKSRELRPHVVLMDVSMPKLDGVEATRRILDELPGVRVIALSMHDDPATRERMQRAGAEQYVSKDIASSKIVAAIRGEPDDDDAPGNGAEPVVTSS